MLLGIRPAALGAESFGPMHYANSPLVMLNWAITAICRWLHASICLVTLRLVTPLYLSFSPTYSLLIVLDDCSLLFLLMLCDCDSQHAESTMYSASAARQPDEYKKLMAETRKAPSRQETWQFILSDPAHSDCEVHASLCAVKGR